jgi:hypothetical protein
VIADALEALKAAVTGNRARRFAAATRVIWFAGYLRESWFGPGPPAPAAWKLVEER